MLPCSVVLSNPECSKATIESDYEDGQTWARYRIEVQAAFTVHRKHSFMGTQHQEMESIPAKDMIPNQSRNAANIKKHIPPKTGFRGLFSVIRSGRVGS